MGKKIVVDDDEIVYHSKRSELVAPARVRSTFGVTKNLGDFNSIRMDFTYEDDFAEGEDFDAAAERTYRAVEAKVEAALNEYEDE